MKRYAHAFLKYVLTASLFLVCSQQAQALSITYTNIYSHDMSAVGNYTGIGLDPALLEAAVTPFNPALGTLNDISISFYGELYYSGGTGANLLPIGAYGSMLPVPYTLQTEFSLGITGIGGDFFTLTSPVVVRNLLPATGVPSYPISAFTTFAFSFDYVEIFDQFVGNSASCNTCTGGYLPPFGMNASLDGFIDDGTLFNNLFFNYSLSFLGINQTGAPTPTVLNAHSTLFINTTYTYTLVETVPEPGGLALLGTGLFMLSLVFAKRRTS